MSRSYDFIMVTWPSMEQFLSGPIPTGARRLDRLFFILSLSFFSSPEPKAHRWAYRIPMVRRPSSSVRPSVVRPSSTISNIFFSKTAWPIKAKFYVEPPWEGGTKVCSRHLGHMTNMAATPIYGKNPSKIFFSRTGGPIPTKLGM